MRCARSAPRSTTLPRTSSSCTASACAACARATVDCGNAGTLMRLIMGVLAGQSGRFELTGDASLSARPMERIAEPLRQMGAAIETTDGHAPVVIDGSRVARRELRAAGRERAGEVGRAARRAERRRADDRRRAGADARPHRADARERGRARRAAADGGDDRARGGARIWARSTCPATSRPPRRSSPRPRSCPAATSRSTT